MLERLEDVAVHHFTFPLVEEVRTRLEFQFCVLRQVQVGSPHGLSRQFTGFLLYAVREVRLEAVLPVASKKFVVRAFARACGLARGASIAPNWRHLK